MSTSLGENGVATVQLRADYQLDLTGTGVVTSNTAGQQRVTQVTGSATTIGPFSQDMMCVLVGGAGGLTFETSSSLAGVGGGAAAFTDLDDAPNTYAGNQGLVPSVNADEDALNFTDHITVVSGAGSAVTLKANGSGGVRLLSESGSGGVSATVDGTGGISLANNGDGVLSIRADGSGDLSMSIYTGNFTIEGLPTSDPAAVGAIWNDAGTLKISAGV